MSLITGNAYILLTITSLCWAGNAIAGQLARGQISPMMVTMLRWLIVAGLLAVIYRKELRQYWPEIRAHGGKLIAMASIGFTGFNALFYLASTKTTGVNIGILQGSIPVIVLIGSFFVYRTAITALQAVGVLVTLTGAITVAVQGDFGRLLALNINPGDGIMLFACVLYSGYTVALKNRPKLPGLVFMTVLAIIAFAASLPLALLEFLTGNVIWPTSQGWMVTFFIALFPSFIAQICFIRGVELIGPGRAGVFVNLVPVFAALLAVLILGEIFRNYHGLALALVLGGIWLAERGKAKLAS